MASTPPAGRTAGRSTGHRAATALITLIIALAALPSLALAAPPLTSVANLYSSAPDRMVTSGGTLDFTMQFIDTSESSVSFSYWDPGAVPGRDPGLGGFISSIRLEGDRVVGEMFVLDGTELIGTAPFSLAFTPAGEPIATQDVRREGNIRTVTDLVTRPMSVSGTFALPGGPTFSIEAPGTHDTYTVTSSAPASTVFDGTETFVNAAWELGDRTYIFRFIETAITSESYAFVLDGTGEIVGAARPKMVDGRVVADYALQRAGRIPAGSASVDVTIRTIRSWTYFETGPGFIQRVVEDEIGVKGSFTVTVDGETVELSLADAAVDSHQYAWHGSQRPMKDDGGGGGEG